MLVENVRILNTHFQGYLNQKSLIRFSKLF